MLWQMGGCGTNPQRAEAVALFSATAGSALWAAPSGLGPLSAVSSTSKQSLADPTEGLGKHRALGQGRAPLHPIGLGSPLIPSEVLPQNPSGNGHRSESPSQEHVCVCILVDITLKPQGCVSQPGDLQEMKPQQRQSAQCPFLQPPGQLRTQPESPGPRQGLIELPLHFKWVFRQGGQPGRLAIAITVERKKMQREEKYSAGAVFLTDNLNTSARLF